MGTNEVKIGICKNIPIFFSLATVLIVGLDVRKVINQRAAVQVVDALFSSILFGDRKCVRLGRCSFCKGAGTTGE